MLLKIPRHTGAGFFIFSSSVKNQSLTFSVFAGPLINHGGIFSYRGKNLFAGTPPVARLANVYNDGIRLAQQLVDPVGRNSGHAFCVARLQQGGMAENQQKLHEK